MLTAAILTFAHTLGEFGVVLMVGGNLPGETRTLSVAIYDRMQAFDDRSAGVMAATLLVIAVVTLMTTTTLSRRWARAVPDRRLAVTCAKRSDTARREFSCDPGDVLAIFGPSGVARPRFCVGSPASPGLGMARCSPVSTRGRTRDRGVWGRLIDARWASCSRSTRCSPI